MHKILHTYFWNYILVENVKKKRLFQTFIKEFSLIKCNNNYVFMIELDCKNVAKSRLWCFIMSNFRKKEKKIIYQSLIILNEFRLNLCRYTLIVEIPLFYLYYYFCALRYFPFEIDKNHVQWRKDVLRKHYRTIEIIVFCGNHITNVSIH